ncbi:hypothetical protein ACEPAG_9302 [Sanghuangporus baumii]
MAVKKILALHGYSQNATIFYKKLGALRKYCGKGIEFVFVDAPHILRPVDLEGINPTALGVAEAAVDSEPNPEELPRGWWRTNPERTKYDGVAESVAVLRDVLAKNRFDGVFGFSQGAAMAALIAAILEKPHLYPPFLIDGQAPHPPMTFCIVISGFKPIDPNWKQFFDPDYQTPTLHVFGLNDVVMTPERTRSLIEVSANRRVASHTGGHFVPANAPWKLFLREYIKDPFGNVPQPATSDEALALATSLNGTPTTSTPASGRVSPMLANP